MILRAPCRNARILWVTQIQKAIDSFEIDTSRKSGESSIDAAGLGRLLIELSFVGNIETSLTCDKQIVCRFELGKHSATGEANLKNEECLFTTQLPIISMDSIFHVSIFIPCIYSPDICAGTGEIKLEDLITATSSHRGPISRQFYLDANHSNTANRPFVIIKFVVQLF
ncbi:unnamed protein product [Dracunculus medinensis]|uniref:PH domain-containing protein n=1 Tax=Dracunculus medinensis TaxID=318479 RepID=A0A0N4U545_DRAME|nr:unnamed protein product [Dracunculus medinensis]